MAGDRGRGRGSSSSSPCSSPSCSRAEPHRWSRVAAEPRRAPGPPLTGGLGSPPEVKGSLVERRRRLEPRRLQSLALGDQRLELGLEGAQPGVVGRAARASSSCSPASRRAASSSARSSRATSLRAARAAAATPASVPPGAPAPRRPRPRPARPRGTRSTPPGRWRSRAVADQREHVVADPLDEVAVVADHDQRARPAVEQVLERGQRVDVEVVGRLVEQQDVGLGQQQPQQLQPPPLAAGQVAAPASTAGRRGSRSARPAGRPSAPRRRRASRAGATSSTASSTRSSAGQLADVLREVRQRGRSGRVLTSPAVGLELAGQQPQQRGLARAVDPDQRRRGRRARAAR